ncbi:MAG TPA: DNA topoisomerase, partial [Pyrinomonadaceae bacterium]|nr:DNA topoisomerase [Pyrinomonadaceae bacterium]
MRVFLAEKPSVAKEIAFCLGGASRHDGYWTTANGDFVTFAVGHLVEIADPEKMNPEWKVWSAETLPMIPTEFIYQANEGTKKQLDIVCRLFTQSGVTEIINACDAEREGELIFWLAYNYAKANKPVKRFWLSSTTTEAIKQELRSLKPAAQYEGLRQAATLRQQADWLVGLNATRAMTLTARSLGGNGTYSLGRVQTPTLKLIVERDTLINNFVPVPFFVIDGIFSPLVSSHLEGNESGENQTFVAHHCSEKLEIIRFETKA